MPKADAGDREPTPHDDVFGVLAEFNRPEALIDAVRRARAAGYRQFDAYSPFPVEGLAEAMAFRDRRIGWLTLIGGLLGAAAGWALQAYANLDFPIDIGGRPLIANPAFAMVTIELALLGAVLCAVIGLLWLNHLPRLHHPLFDIESFHLASRDKFFLAIFGNDPQFDRAATAGFLAGLDPLRVDVVDHTEQPE